MNLKKIVIALSIGTMFSSSLYATGYPVVDLSALMQLANKAKQDVDEFNQSIKSWTNELNASIQGQAESVNAMNNGFANSIVRNNQALDDHFNNQLKMEMQPSSDACATYSIASAMNDAVCSLLTNISDASESRVNNYMNKGTSMSALSRSEDNANQIIQEGTELNHESDGVTSNIVRADIMLGSQGDTYDEDNMKTTKVFNDVILGAGVKTAPSKENADDRVSYVDNYLRPNAMRAVSANSLDTIRSLRVGQDKNPNKPSIMQLMQKFVDSHFGTPEGNKWLRVVTNTQDSAGDFMSDSAVLRSIAQMQAFSNYLNMMEYQSELRQETIQASLLALKNKQVYGN
jgi:hypothetical protein